MMHFSTSEASPGVRHLHVTPQLEMQRIPLVHDSSNGVVNLICALLSYCRMVLSKVNCHSFFGETGSSENCFRNKPVAMEFSCSVCKYSLLIVSNFSSGDIISLSEHASLTPVSTAVARIVAPIIPLVFPPILFAILYDFGIPLHYQIYVITLQDMVKIHKSIIINVDSCIGCHF